MSGTLDKFFGASATKSQVQEERCSNPKCRKLLKPPTIKYTLRVKGKEGVYCQPCAKAILHPQENAETL